LVTKAYTKYELKLNYDPGKTGAMLAFRGKHARSVRIAFARTKNRIVFNDGTSDQVLRVVQRYIHLGTSTVITGSIDTEIAFRIKSAAAALSKIRPLLRLGLGFKANLTCIKLYFCSRLFYAAGCWPVLSQRNLNKLRTAYGKAVRAALGQSWDSTKPVLTDVQLRSTFGFNDVADMVDARRLKFFSRVAVDASEAFRTVLSASVLVVGSYANALVEAFTLVRAFRKLASMPLFTDDPHRWSDLASLHAADFKEIVGMWLDSRVGQVRVSLCADDVSRSVCTDVFLPYVCSLCNLAFASAQALGQHKRRVHGFINPIRLMVWGSLCPVCAVEFHTRPRLVQHLSFDGRSCREEFLAGEPLELPIDFIRQLDAKDAVLARQNRRAGLPERQAVLPALPSSVV
jgi:hypothetical protein